MFLQSLFLFLVLSQFCTSNTLTPEELQRIQDSLETEIDLREPRDFKSWETLSVRLPGFQTYQVKGADGSIQNVNAGNWEKWTGSYWYETRLKGAICPMVPSGISANVDWALLSPCLFGDPTKPPKTIFVHNLMLPHFAESTFNFMNKSWNFVLITGGTDQTTPRSALDSRYRAIRGFGGWDGGPYFQRLLNSPQVIHWFMENHDLNADKISTLPTGMSVDDPDDRTGFPHQSLALHQRPLMVMKADRIRDGRGQWADRYNVEQMCAQASFCLQPFKGEQSSTGTSHKDFLEHLVSVPFIACVHGGGIDPSPKAYESIIAGTIPILMRSNVDDAYGELPIAFVDKWEDLFLSPNATEMLQKWVVELAPYYARGSELRWQTLEKLKTSYWVGKFYRKYWEFEEKQSGEAVRDRERVRDRRNARSLRQSPHSAPALVTSLLASLARFGHQSNPTSNTTSQRDLEVAGASGTVDKSEKYTFSENMSKSVGSDKVRARSRGLGEHSAEQGRRRLRN